MADHTGGSTEQKGQFAPRQAVQLNPPKDDPITLEYLSKCDGELALNVRYSFDSSKLTNETGEHEGYPTLVAIKVQEPTQTAVK